MLNLKYFFAAYRSLQERLARHHLQHEQQLFKKNGYKPWTPGYNTYKWEAISKLLFAEKSFYEVLGTSGFGYRIDERIVEYGWLFEKLTREPATMLDAGSALNHWVIVNHPKLHNKKLFISTLAPEGFAFTERGISYVYEDLRETCFHEAMFDCISCISTIEHVGLDNSFLYTSDMSKAEQSKDEYLPFIDILRSRLKPRGTLYISFPYGRYKNHRWFQVFDASMLSSVIERFNPCQYKEDIFQYKNNCWCLSSREQAKNASCFDINVQKEYDDDYAAFSRAVACLELVR